MSIHTDFLNTSRKISYLKILTIILSKCHWLLCGLFIGIIAASLHLYVSTPQYIASASLKFEEKRSEISELISVRNIYDRNNKAESEKFIIQSRSVIRKAITNLNYPISFYFKSGINTIDIYPQRPVKVVLIRLNNLTGKTDNSIEFTAIDKYHYKLCTTLNGELHCNTYSYGEILSLPQAKIKITSNPLVPPGTIYLLKFNHLTTLLTRVCKALQIDETQNTNTLSLKVTDPNPYFAADILNSIVDQYLIFDKVQRSASAFETEKFINSLLKPMSNALLHSGKDIQKFREDRQLLSIPSYSENAANQLARLETELYILDVEGVQINLLEKVLATNIYPENLNSNLQGIKEVQLNNLLTKYNELLIKRKETLSQYTTHSTIITNINDQIDYLKIAIINNITACRNNYTSTRLFIKNQIDSIKKDLNSIPQAEREFTTLQSKFDINQKVYNYLEEKRLESQIAKASVIPGAVVIDKATYAADPISPIPLNIYTVYILLSIGVGIGVILLVRILNPYVYNRETIEELTTIPIISIVRKCNNKNLSTPLHSNSLFSESLRSLRSSLNFLTCEEGNKIICITSEVSGEGKSFISLNLAHSLTLIDKKVLLVAADLRKSNLHRTLKVSNQNGLSKYLSAQTPLADIITNTEINNLDFISSGPIPPNPSELLHTKNMQDLFCQLKEKYDFIIIDSAPIGLVTDGASLLKKADINLFIIRAGISKHAFTTTPERLKKELNLSNFYIVLNDFQDKKFHRDYYSGKRMYKGHNSYYESHIGYTHHKNYLEL